MTLDPTMAHYHAVVSEIIGISAAYLPDYFKSADLREPGTIPLAFMSIRVYGDRHTPLHPMLLLETIYVATTDCETFYSLTYIPGSRAKLPPLGRRLPPPKVRELNDQAKRAAVQALSEYSNKVLAC